MAKYLLRGSYTIEGLKGLLKEGGSKRKEAVKLATEALGGKLEAFYFALGEDDFFIITDTKDIEDPNVLSIASSIMANVSGTLKLKTTVLLTPEEVDEAVKRTAELQYRPPGQ